MFPHERQQRLVDYCDAQEVPTGAPARARMRIDGTCCLRKRANAIVRDCDALGMQPRLSKIAEATLHGSAINTVTATAQGCCAACNDLPLCSGFVLDSDGCTLMEGVLTPLTASAWRSTAYIRERDDPIDAASNSKLRVLQSQTDPPATPNSPDSPDAPPPPPDYPVPSPPCQNPGPHPTPPMSHHRVRLLLQFHHLPFPRPIRLTPLSHHRHLLLPFRGPVAQSPFCLAASANLTTLSITLAITSPAVSNSARPNLPTSSLSGATSTSAARLP